MPEEAEEPILARTVRGALLEWLTEIWAADELAKVGLQPRRRALFHGPPGTGKTTLAHHLAARLGLPLLVVRPADIVGRYLGTGISNVKKIFDAIDEREEPVVLFFDEFETAAQKRMHSGLNEAAEHDHNAMVNELLARIEAHEGFIITATNRGDAIDPAIWRRFEIQIRLDVPGQGERTRILARYLAPFGLPRPALAKLAESLETAAPALMRQFCEGLKRHMIIGPKAGWDMSRAGAISRLVAAFQPHPDLGLPRLWSLGAEDEAVRCLTWPLPLAADLAAEAPADDPTPAEKIVAFPARSTRP